MNLSKLGKERHAREQKLDSTQTYIQTRTASRITLQNAKDEVHEGVQWKKNRLCVTKTETQQWS